MRTEDRIWPDIAIPPGETLAETLETLGMSQAELARRADRPVQAINEIIRGVKEITPETALQFERVLGVSAHVWINLDANYRLTKARLAEKERLRSEVSLASKYPYRAMARLGWVARIREPRERVSELLRFFGVVSLRDVPLPAAAGFRRSTKRDASIEALAAWLRQGERQAQGVETDSFNEARLREAIPEVRSLTRESPNVFEPRLTEVLAHCGVALVLVPHLPRTYAHGATRWIRRDKALVQMSIRYRWDDIFWFSLFHELGHLLLHGREQIFIEYTDAVRDEREQQADAFASERLIPSTAYQTFLQRAQRPSKPAVVEFAREQSIAPSIIVGRLQHDAYIPHSHLNHLRARFQWAT